MDSETPFSLDFCEAKPKKPRSVSMNVDSGEKTWLTPRYFFAALGEFDLDPCCPPKMPWKTAAEMVCRPADGLAVDWNGKRVWLNPPYGRESVPFFEKMVAHEGGGVALVFARTDTSLWQDIIFPHAYAVLFLRGRVRFCHADGSLGETSTAPSALIAFSKRDAELLSDISATQGDNMISGFIVVN